MKLGMFNLELREYWFVTVQHCPLAVYPLSQNALVISADNSWVK